MRHPSPHLSKTTSQQWLTTIFSANGRAFPDVAARGDGFRVIMGSGSYSIGGTSASAPVRRPLDKSVRCVLLTLFVPFQTVAGLVSLLNDYRITHGSPPLGFLNPFLYSKGVAGLVDVVVCAFSIGVRDVEHCADEIHTGYRVGVTLVVGPVDSTRPLVGIR